MQFTISFLIGLHIIFCILLDFAFAKPMIGVNVRQAVEGEFPSVVAIKKIFNVTVQPRESLICTGTLISSLYVLTAEHCLEHVTVPEVEIIVGTIDIRLGTKHFPLWWVDYYRWANCSEEYKKYRVHDIAIIKLTVPVDEKIQPAKSSNRPNIFHFNKYATIAGWGIKNDSTIALILQTVTVKILHHIECEQRIDSASGISDHKLPPHFLCSVGEPFALATSGDSGGPILVDNILVGIQISSMPFPKLLYHPDKVNVHITVYSYKEFFEDVMNGGVIW